MRNSGRSGVTLIELVAVVLIVGLVFAAGLGAMRRMPRAELAETARRTLALSEACRNAARMHGARRDLVYDLDAGRAWIEDRSSVKEGEEPARVLAWRLPSGIRLDAVATAAGEEARDGQVRLAALPGGYLQPHLVRLSSGGADLAWTVAVAALPGTSRLKEGTLAWEEAFRTETEEDVDGVKAVVK